MDLLKLSALGLWTDWQKRVVNNFPNFCNNGDFVSQGYWNEKQFDELADKVAAQKVVYDLEGRDKDKPFGVEPWLVNTKHYGKVSRAWLETNREIDIISQHVDINGLSILDVGAGYGRLASVLSKHVKNYIATDAVEISTSICKYYTQLYNAPVQVMSLSDLFIAYKTNTLPKFDLAINVHSWNECNKDTIEQWLNFLKDIKVPYLFTVAHPTDNVSYYGAYRGGNFKPLLEQQYNLLHHSLDGLEKCPHDFWKLKEL